MERLPSCDKWHLDEPSVIRKVLGTYRKTESCMRRVCSLCSSRRRTHNRDRLKIKQKTYGVIPLNWPAPEGV